MATQKCWVLKYIVGNPAMFTRVVTDSDSPYRRQDALEAAEKVAANKWRVWVEHVTTGKRIFESEIETRYRLAGDTTPEKYGEPDESHNALRA